MLLFCIFVMRLYAQPNDSNKIVISDVGNGITMKLGDTVVTFSYESLYNQFIQNGIEYGSKQQYDDAISNFQTALLYIWDDPVAYYYLGLAYMYKEDLEKALEEFNYAIRLDPKHYLSLNERGIIYSKNGEYFLAKSDFDKAIEINPEYSEAYLNMGITHLIENDYIHGCEYIAKAKDMGNERAGDIYLNYCGN